MKNEHEPRADDHLVEPMYQALREDDGAQKSGEPSVRSKDGDWRWKILWVIVAILAIGYVVWRQAF